MTARWWLICGIAAMVICACMAQRGHRTALCCGRTFPTVNERRQHEATHNKTRGPRWE